MKKWVILFMAMLAVQSGATAQNAPHPQIYREIRVTPGMIAQALRSARAQNKFLMIEFGANWCEDCVALARNLEQGEASEYFQKHFVVLKIDVGQFERNLDVAKSLAADLDKGIPTAVFFAPDGNRIGATNKGELEPSRKYGTKEIYGFLKEVAERRLITTPGR